LRRIAALSHRRGDNSVSNRAPNGNWDIRRGKWGRITASGGYLFTKSLIFVFILVIGCSKPGIMIVSRKAAEAVSRSLSCDKADRKSSFLPLFFQTPFARDPAAKKQRDLSSYSWERIASI
jgi:hypothetical protein